MDAFLLCFKIMMKFCNQVNGPRGQLSFHLVHLKYSQEIKLNTFKLNANNNIRKNIFYFIMLLTVSVLPNPK